MVSFEWSLKNLCLAMAVPTGPSPTPLLIIVKNIGIDIVQTCMKPCKRIFNRPNSKQTLILPVHIKSQLSYAAITEKFCIRKLYNL